ncbi:MAG TPA: L-threonylcarbamoyladenylate synthase [Pyrinomonadaceae bacterium]|nr:L-threonylcarbamoyladenylate synthase [Pyrinomonadaceae bacterium]
MIISQTTESFSRIAQVIARGGVIAFRTDTVYGLGADPFNLEAVQKLKQLKGREGHKPILIIVSDRAAVSRYVAAPTTHFELLAKTFWPGPLTLIGMASPEVPDEITAGTQTVGVRLPFDEDVRALVELCGGALTATSANPAGEKPAETAEEAFAHFGESIDLVVDGGKTTSGQPSTVVDVSTADPRLIREGTIAWPEIQATIARCKAKT